MADDTKPPDDEKPAESRPAAVFKTDADWTRARKKLELEGAKNATAAILGKLGLDSEEQLEEFKAKLAGTDAVKSEAEKHKSELSKAMKRIEALAKENEGFKADRNKLRINEATSAHSSKFRHSRDVDKYLATELVVNDDGEVVGRDGKSVDDVVSAVLEANDFLRAPAFKPGPGTSATPHKPAAQPSIKNGSGKPDLAAAQANLSVAAREVFRRGS